MAWEGRKGRGGDYTSKARGGGRKGERKVSSPNLRTKLRPQKTRNADREF